MTVPALAAPVTDRAPRASRLRLAPSLDAAISARWARIGGHRSVACPICHGEMEPEYGVGALPVAGRCRECGSVLS